MVGDHFQPHITGKLYLYQKELVPVLTVDSDLKSLTY